METKTSGSASADYFVAGGTLPLNSESYIERTADGAILAALSSGRFCYVLNSRQMGKSSLCVRTMSRLATSGTQCAFIDITKLGGRNVTHEQWYAGLAIEVGRSLNLRDEILAYWQKEGHVSPMQRFFSSLRDVVLNKISGRVVVFVDEIDSTRSLSFNTDEFFAGVRECFNRRVQDPEFSRLTFCFLGVAVPSDLIHDARTTPFNVGERIYLKDFSRLELDPLSPHLGSSGKKALDRVHYWTNGHPYLTQSLCRALVATGGEISEREVDGLIERDLLEPKVRETNINLSDVGNRVLNGYADGDDVEKFRADILSAYGKARSGKEVLQDDESNRITAILKLSGLMRSENGTLKVRNRIYERAFDEAWIKENLPQQELRRQRRAYYAGVARTALIATAVVAVIGYLAINNYRMARAAEETAREMSWRAYVADMNRMPILLDQNNVPHMEKILAEHQNDPWRGPEWDYWNGTIHTALWETTKEFGKLGEFNPTGHLPYIMVNSEHGGNLFIDRKNGQVARRLEVTKGQSNVQLRGGKRIMAVKSGGGGRLLDALTGNVLEQYPSDIFFIADAAAFDDDGKVCVVDSGLKNGVYDLEKKRFVIERPNTNSYFPLVSRDGKVAPLFFRQGEADWITVYDIEKRSAGRTFSVLGKVRAYFISKDNSLHTVGYEDGMVRQFSAADGSLLWELKIGNDAVQVVATSEDGLVVVAGTRRRRTYQIRVESGVPQLFRSYLDSALPMVSEDGKFIYTLYWTMRGYSADEGEPVKTIQVGGNWGVKFVSHPDRIFLIGRNEAKVMPLIDGTLGAQDVVAFPQGMETWSSPRGQAQVLLSNGTSMAMYDLDNSLQPILSLKQSPQNDFFIRLDAGRVLYSKDRLTYILYNARSGKQEREVQVFETLTQFDLSPSGELLVACSLSGDIALFDSATLNQIWQVKEAHKGRPAIAASFSPDGKKIVTSSHDDTAAIWNVADGSLVARLVGHAQSVIRAVFTPDGKRVITISDDQTMRMWEVATGAELTTLGNVGDLPDLCRVTSDGKYIVTANQQGTIKIWPLYSSANEIKESTR